MHEYINERTPPVSPSWALTSTRACPRAWGSAAGCKGRGMITGLAPPSLPPPFFTCSLIHSCCTQASPGTPYASPCVRHLSVPECPQEGTLELPSQGEPWYTDPPKGS